MLSKIKKEDPKGNRIIVTVIGPDKVGIIAGVAQVLASNKINILDISQTILQEYLVMVMVADMSESTKDMIDLKDKLAEKGREIGVRIDAQHEDVFSFMHRI
ncbi:ACT domain-containing protein [Pelotomaculum propionicicum]|uniref:ACT domain-containing protein n=1 Tax=Pelotomaculum propionicicum TaxID=258475 RepID=UPI003B7C3614